MKQITIYRKKYYLNTYHIKSNIMSGKLAKVYYNCCANCHTCLPNFVYKEYCDLQCELNHQSKLESQEENTKLLSEILSTLQSIEMRLSIIEKSITQIHTT